MRGNIWLASKEECVVGNWLSSLKLVMQFIGTWVGRSDLSPCPANLQMLLPQNGGVSHRSDELRHVGHLSSEARKQPKPILGGRGITLPPARFLGTCVCGAGNASAAYHSFPGGIAQTGLGCFPNMHELIPWVYYSDFHRPSSLVHARHLCVTSCGMDERGEPAGISSPQVDLPQQLPCAALH